MTRATALLRLAVVGASALALSGCISLLPKAKPAQLYRFGQSAIVRAQPAPVAGAVGVFRASGSFQRESAGDQILTITDGRAAYIAQSRWVAPASVLFDEAVLAAFDADPGRVRLISRGESGTSGYSLRLDVRNFEAHYDAGGGPAPTVVVRVRAAMVRAQDSGVVGDQIIEARVPAADNRVTAIAAAFDKALSEVLAKVVAWTNQQAK